MSPAVLSSVILLGALVLFVSEKVRHDLIAVIALVACLIFGLVTPANAFEGFADPAVVAVASVLVVGRALELTGAASAVAHRLMPKHLDFGSRLAILLAIAAFLSAFMNNIAALVITMPLATALARETGHGPGATLMPLAFATILGGMTTLIGTPANLILSSVRERELGTPFGFFAMTPVGLAVCAVGLIYLAFAGWRLLPRRRTGAESRLSPWRVFDLQVASGALVDRTALLTALRSAKARLLALYAKGNRVAWPLDGKLSKGDRLVVLSRQDHRSVAAALPLSTQVDPVPAAGRVTARMTVAYGSRLIGNGHDAVRFETRGELAVIGAGPRSAALRSPLAALTIEAGDQLFIEGTPDALAAHAARLRLLEIDRTDAIKVDVRRALRTVAIFLIAIAAIIVGGVNPALAFLGAAAAIAAFRLMPSDEVYKSIDWSVIVLLGAMIPVGASFESSGAAGHVADFMGSVLAGYSLPMVIASVCAATLLLSIFLNNVATSVIMGPLAIKLASLLGVNPDALLLAVLIGASSDFLTPIGHQNNLLVMGPGGYRFSDYARAGALLSLLVITTSAAVLASLFG